MSAATARRTDIHRPSAPEFDPQDYDCLGVFDLDPEWGDTARRMATVNAQVAQGHTFAGAPHGHAQCSHCGHWPLRYVALMLHRPTGTLLYVGETCLDNRFDGMTKGEFARLRQQAALNRERQSQRARFVELCEQHPDLAYASYARNIGEAGADNGIDCEGSFEWTTKTGYEIGTLIDIARKAERYGSVSEGQLRFVAKLLDRLTAAEERLAARRREAAEATARGVTLPRGRVTVIGEIVKVATQSNDFGTRLVMTVKADAGYRVWGTLPAALDPGQGSLDELRGRRVEFTATLEPSDDDPLFGFIKRPAKARYL
jgi:hypothetical protein